MPRRSSSCAARSTWTDQPEGSQPIKIGKGIAIELADAGFDVALTARTAHEEVEPRAFVMSNASA
jgi:hypothetical protein